MTPLERYAHDLVCVIKYGSPGGSATKNEIKRVMDYLQRVGAPPTSEPKLPRVTLPPIPHINGLPILVNHNPATAPRVFVAPTPPRIVIAPPKP